jgi:aspartyl/asparaginyl-tRNA synthetase
MKISKLLLLALIWTTAGLFLLLLLSATLEPPKIHLNELEQNIGKYVVVEGYVQKAVYKENVVFIELSDGKTKAQAVFFGNPSYEIIENDFVVVKGVVQVYKGAPEIVIKELACPSCENA